jgi:hypothetical protein
VGYTITAGNEDELFEIGADGVISLAEGKALDAATATQHVLTVTVSDRGLSDTVVVAVNVRGPTPLDFVTADFGVGNTVSVRLGDGAGGFASPASGGEVAVGDNVHGVALGDLDGIAALTPTGLPDLGPLVPITADLQL